MKTRERQPAVDILATAYRHNYSRAGMNSSAVEVQEARAQSVRLDNEALTVDLVDGRTIIVPLVWFPRLWHGTSRERKYYEVWWMAPTSTGRILTRI